MSDVYLSVTVRSLVYVVFEKNIVDDDTNYQRRHTPIFLLAACSCTSEILLHGLYFLKKIGLVEKKFFHVFFFLNKF